MKTIQLQPIPYQGSKRNIAQQIMEYYPGRAGRLIEPFAGSAAITLYAAHHEIADKFLINDSSEPLMALWEKIINTPEACAAQYEKIWRKQIGQPEEHYLKIRREFNKDGDPIKFLFLMVRCAKNAIRFNSRGEFNQSADKRRLGRRPDEMKKHIFSTSSLLRGKTQLMNADYEEVLALATPNDFVYMDPPYQGTSSGRNPRYHQGLDLQRFIKNLEQLNKKHIPFMLSFDGQLGEKKYGEPLPSSLKLQHIPIHAGRSSQATLNGKKEMTIESLYISPSLEPVPNRRLFPIAA
jgi:DNA adenine methylase